MGTFEWVIIALSFGFCICIGRMNSLLIKSRGVNVFSMLVALATLIGGIFLLSNENITPFQEIIVVGIMIVIYLSIFLSLYFTVCKEEEKMKEENRRYIR